MIRLAVKNVATGCGAAAGHQEVSSIPGGLSLLLPGSWHRELQASPGSIAFWLIKAWLGDPKFKVVSEGKNHGKAPDVFVGKRIYDKPS